MLSSPLISVKSCSQTKRIKTFSALSGGKHTALTWAQICSCQIFLRCKLLSPDVHHQLLGFSDILLDVVLGLRVTKSDDGVGAVCGHAVMVVEQEGLCCVMLNTQPPTLTTCGLPIKKLETQGHKWLHIECVHYSYLSLNIYLNTFIYNANCMYRRSRIPQFVMTIT